MNGANLLAPRDGRLQRSRIVGGETVEQVLNFMAINFGILATGATLLRNFNGTFNTVVPFITFYDLSCV